MGTNDKGIRRSSLIAGCLTLFVLVFSPGALTPEAAEGHCVTTDKLKVLAMGNDSFKNFDFKSESGLPCNVDWPINLLFKNDASGPKVKAGLNTVGYSQEGGAMHMRIQEAGYGWTWEADKGVKNDPAGCFVGDMEHVRIYGSIYGWESGPGADRMYDMQWGYYVLGTSHIDHLECTPFGWAGNSEAAEDRIADDARRVDGWGPVRNDEGNFYNQLDFEVAGDGHRLHNSGRATYVNVH